MNGTNAWCSPCQHAKRGISRVNHHLQIAIASFLRRPVRPSVPAGALLHATPCYSPRPSGLFRARTRPFGSSVLAVEGIKRAGCDSRTLRPGDPDEEDDLQTPSTANSARLDLPVDDHHAFPHRFTAVQRISSRADHIFDMTSLGSLPSALLARPLWPLRVRREPCRQYRSTSRPGSGP